MQQFSSDWKKANMGTISLTLFIDLKIAFWIEYSFKFCKYID
jgi:hypothetical protein